MSETKIVLLGLLRAPYNEDYKVQVKLGQGEAIIQRVRVEISRIRARAIKAGLGKKLKHFKLKADVYRFQNIKSDTVVFNKYVKHVTQIDMSDINLIIDEVVDEARPKIEAKQREERRQQIIIKRKETVA